MPTQDSRILTLNDCDFPAIESRFFSFLVLLLPVWQYKIRGCAVMLGWERSLQNWPILTDVIVAEFIGSEPRFRSRYSWRHKCLSRPCTARNIIQHNDPICPCCIAYMPFACDRILISLSDRSHPEIFHHNVWVGGPCADFWPDIRGFVWSLKGSERHLG